MKKSRISEYIFENKNLSNLKLLEIKFFSNLVSGNFDAADKVSNKIKLNGENNAFYNLPRYILKIVLIIEHLNSPSYVFFKASLMLLFQK
mgnify:CR=1 FL=1